MCARLIRHKPRPSGRCIDVRDRPLNILFAGGGTGGHLFPGIAIADEIRKIQPDAVITFAGTRDKIEARVVPQRGYKFAVITISGFRRKLTPGNVLFPFKVMIALAQSFSLIRRLKPHVVVGTGGYVCGPVVYAASLLGIPTLIQEQNSYPGVTTRLLASRATQVHLTFESSKRYLRRTDNVSITGNPTRATLGTITRFEGAEFFQLDPQRRTLLVFGGSLGARSINDAVLQMLPRMAAAGIQLIWQTGEDDERIRSFLKEYSGAGWLRVFKFIERMEFAYAACDLALCRAGATTIAEIARAGVPSVLVPYPYAAADHQTGNARAMVEEGASMMIADGELTTRLQNTVMELLQAPEILKQMGEKAGALSKPKAAAMLARAVIDLAKA